MSAEAKAFDLWMDLSFLLGAYKRLQKDTNSEPLFENVIVEKVEKSLFKNRPFADWEDAR